MKIGCRKHSGMIRRGVPVDMSYMTNSLPKGEEESAPAAAKSLGEVRVIHLCFSRACAEMWEGESEIDNRRGTISVDGINHNTGQSILSRTVCSLDGECLL